MLAAVAREITLAVIMVYASPELVFLRAKSPPKNN